MFHFTARFIALFLFIGSFVTTASAQSSDPALDTPSELSPAEGPSETTEEQRQEQLLQEQLHLLQLEENRKHLLAIHEGLKESFNRRDLPTQQNFYSHTFKDVIHFPPHFKAALAELEQKSQALWQKFVEAESSPYSRLESPLKETIKKSPRTVLEVPFLNEIEKIHKLYKDEKWIGYAINFADHVDAEMIQDGSGFVLLLDIEMNIVARTDWPS